ncbi:ATP-binding cassette domain-containing protein [Methanoculleus sp. FWC-SCC1]|uniref:ABC transporter ATP-binding protein n=1 Tax=Methanoculleus frigidifontis TaxID=2584085 RepID=A0ABT8MB44_9EURY|nr:ATP-binding cassette domain-containing protein [Methanoculleus sp. FWC-SCC1]MDN7025151.1 ATP-binding cassette domain-containing protein [Methanoculleus sp. FWC-SCC1]
MEGILEIQNARYRYPHGPEALRGVSIRIVQGSKVALVGPNGAGKSTLFQLFNGMIRPDAGTVSFGGAPIEYTARALRDLRRRVGLVFQNPDVQIIAPTVYQDVAFGPVNLGLARDAIDRAVRDALSAVGLAGYEKRPPHHLSGGEKKRVAIAGILAMEPDVLVFDEPTSSLDPASSEEIMELLDELATDGRTIIISTHDVELAYRWADHVILMEQGMVLARGSPEEVFADHALLRAARLKPPRILDLYHELVARGIVEDRTPPRSVLAFTDCIEQHLHGSSLRTAREAAGTVYICNVDAVDGDAVRRLITERPIGHTGAMGTRAKEFANRELILLDFTYGVIDKCILKSLIGESSLILSSGGMIDHTHRRIAEYSAESGRALIAVTVPEPMPPGSAGRLPGYL